MYGVQSVVVADLNVLHRIFCTEVFCAVLSLHSICLFLLLVFLHIFTSDHFESLRGILTRNKNSLAGK